MNARGWMIALCAAGLTTATAAAQVPSRDARTPATPKGTAEMTVVVSTDEPTSRPLRRVSVSIQAGEIDVPHIGVTDDDGRVVFRALAAGNYLLTASRPGYVRTFYGSALPGRGPGVAVTVLDGQRLAGLRIRMLRGSVITGILRSASGQPAPNQFVQALMVRSAAGEKRAINIEGSLGLATTDDRGSYRIYGLAPGDYIVSIPALGFGAQDMRPMTVEELRWADKAVAAGAGPETAANLPPAPPSAPTVAYSPVYYPGTAIAAEAAVITVGPDEERAGVEFSLQFVPTAQVRGRVLDAEGRPQNGLSVSLRPARADGLDLFTSLLNGSGRTLPDGTFTLQAVKPGSYTLSVRATPRASSDASAAPDQADLARQMIAAATGSAPAGATHWAAEDITVQGRDVTDIALTLRPGMSLTGKIVYEATTKTPPTDLSRTALALTTAPTGTTPSDLVSSLGAGRMSATVAADGAFSIIGIAPGRYRLSTTFGLVSSPVAAAVGGGWTLKSVMANGRDVADAPLEIKAGTDVSGVVVTFTDRPSELSGTVFDALGRVTPNFPIIVFATDRGYWTPASRRVQQARPASDGKFKVTGLPAGEYFVCAVTAVDRTELYDPAFLEQLAAVSFKITIADGEKKTQDLKLGGG